MPAVATIPPPAPRPNSSGVLTPAVPLPPSTSLSPAVEPATPSPLSSAPTPVIAEGPTNLIPPGGELDGFLESMFPDHNWEQYDQPFKL